MASPASSAPSNCPWHEGAPTPCPWIELPCYDCINDALLDCFLTQLSRKISVSALSQFAQMFCGQQICRNYLIQLILEVTELEIGTEEETAFKKDMRSVAVTIANLGTRLPKPTKRFLC